MTNEPDRTTATSAQTSARTRAERADGRETRRRIMEVAVGFFAEHGIDFAPLGEIAIAAGQANRSAVQYHFGSRQGLVREIMLARQVSIDADRALRNPDGLTRDIETLVREVIEPVAADLQTVAGRDYLVIMPQVLHQYSDALPAVATPEPLKGLLDSFEAALGHLPQELAAERVVSIVAFAADGLGRRARERRKGAATPAVSDDEFVENLIQMTIGALLAPAPQASKRVKD